MEERPSAEVRRLFSGYGEARATDRFAELWRHVKCKESGKDFNISKSANHVAIHPLMWNDIRFFMPLGQFFGDKTGVSWRVSTFIATRWDSIRVATAIYSRRNKIVIAKQ